MCNSPNLETSQVHHTYVEKQIILHSHTMQYYYSIRRDLLFIYATTEGNLKIITLCEGSQTKKKAHDE